MDSENFFHECFPCRFEGLYEHVKPFVRQRSHAGCFLSHFTLAVEQASQVDRSLKGPLDVDIGLARALACACELRFTVVEKEVKYLLYPSRI